MKCKNCNNSIHIDTNFCDECGAKVLQERITFKHLKKDVLSRFFGWDNKLFLTTKMLYTKPHILITEYLQGVRKKYMNPFSYFAVVVAISFLVFTQFEKQFTQLNDISFIGEPESEVLAISNDTLSVTVDTVEYEQQLSDSLIQHKSKRHRSQSFDKNEMMAFLLKYFNILQFINLPFYALISFLVYRKRFNYGEHLVINAFFQGALAVFSFFFFFIGFFSSAKLGSIQYIVTVLYYFIVMKLLHQHTWKKSIVMFGKFLGILMLLFVLSIIVGILVLLPLVYFDIVDMKQ